MSLGAFMHQASLFVDEPLSLSRFDYFSPHVCDNTYWQIADLQNRMRTDEKHIEAILCGLQTKEHPSHWDLELMDFPDKFIAGSEETLEGRASNSERKFD